MPGHGRLVRANAQASFELVLLSVHVLPWPRDLCCRSCTGHGSAGSAWAFAGPASLVFGKSRAQKGGHGFSQRLRLLVVRSGIGFKPEPNPKGVLGVQGQPGHGLAGAEDAGVCTVRLPGHTAPMLPYQCSKPGRSLPAEPLCTWEAANALCSCQCFACSYIFQRPETW